MTGTASQFQQDDSEQTSRSLRELAALEALCLAFKNPDSRTRLEAVRRSLDSATDSVGANAPLMRRFSYRAGIRVLVLAGSTDTESDRRLAKYEPPLQEALSSFKGYLVTGGTCVGVCGLAARCAAHANASGTAHVELVGYLPAQAEASPDFPNIVRTVGSDFSLLEPLQMWTDLLVSGIPPASVTLLCLGGGVISAQELALAWVLGARVAALECDAVAPTRFAALLANADRNDNRGMILPDDPDSLRSFITYDESADVVKSDPMIQQQEEHDNE